MAQRNAHGHARTHSIHREHILSRENIFYQQRTHVRMRESFETQHILSNSMGMMGHTEGFLRSVLRFGP